MKFTKEQLQSLKKLLLVIKDEMPFRKKSSIVMIGSIDISVFVFSLLEMFKDDKDFELIIEGLVASGLTFSFIVLIIYNYAVFSSEEERNSCKKRIR